MHIHTYVHISSCSLVLRAPAAKQSADTDTSFWTCSCRSRAPSLAARSTTTTSARPSPPGSSCRCVLSKQRMLRTRAIYFTRKLLSETSPCTTPFRFTRDTSLAWIESWPFISSWVPHGCSTSLSTQHTLALPLRASTCAHVAAPQRPPSVLRDLGSGAVSCTCPGILSPFGVRVIPGNIKWVSLRAGGAPAAHGPLPYGEGPPDRVPAPLLWPRAQT